MVTTLLTLVQSLTFIGFVLFVNFCICCGECPMHLVLQILPSIASFLQDQ